jgi:hypothetical protein
MGLPLHTHLCLTLISLHLIFQAELVTVPSGTLQGWFPLQDQEFPTLYYLWLCSPAPFLDPKEQDPNSLGSAKAGNDE